MIQYYYENDKHYDVSFLIKQNTIFNLRFFSSRKEIAIKYNEDFNTCICIFNFHTKCEHSKRMINL
jgi:hypothetical protein